MIEWQENYNSWLNQVDSSTKKKLEKMKIKEKQESFSSELSFGTAGIRAKLGLGTNKINKYTVIKYIRAFAKYLKKEYESDKLRNNGILIFHDNRNMSAELSLIIAKTFSWLGIRAVLAPDNILEPTPLLSYYVGKHDYIGGINVTASHNPKEYNGIKFYNSKGSQIENSVSKKIQKNYEKLSFFDFKQTSQYIFYLDKNFADEYYEQIIKPQIKKIKSKLKILFSPQHGTSLTMAQRIFNDMNVNLFLVKSQISEDPNFSNTINPNPGSPDAFKQAIKDAMNKNISIIISIDPDGDRLGLMLKDGNNWIHLSGNDLSNLMLFYIIKNTKSSKLKHSFIVKSNVTSDQGKRMAEKHNVSVFEGLTGFKNLSNLALSIIDKQVKKNIKEKNILKPLFIYEESYGSIVDYNVRDKDSFQALVLIIKILDYLEQQKLTVSDILDSINKKYGYTKSIQYSLEVNDLDEVDDYLEKINNLFKDSNLKLPSRLKIKTIENMEKPLNKSMDKIKGIKIWFENGSWIVIRPSGTEPILKFYFDLFELNQDDEEFILNLFKDI